LISTLALQFAQFNIACVHLQVSLEEVAHAKKQKQVETEAATLMKQALGKEQKKGTRSQAFEHRGEHHNDLMESAGSSSWLISRANMLVYKKNPKQEAPDEKGEGEFSFLETGESGHIDADMQAQLAHSQERLSARVSKASEIESTLPNMGDSNDTDAGDQPETSISSNTMTVSMSFEYSAGAYVSDMNAHETSASRRILEHEELDEGAKVEDDVFDVPLFEVHAGPNQESTISLPMQTGNAPDGSIVPLYGRDARVMENDIGSAMHGDSNLEETPSIEDETNGEDQTKAMTPREEVRFKTAATRASHEKISKEEFERGEKAITNEQRRNAGEQMVKKQFDQKTRKMIMSNDAHTKRANADELKGKNEFTAEKQDKQFKLKQLLEQHQLENKVALRSAAVSAQEVKTKKDNIEHLDKQQQAYAADEMKRMDAEYKAVNDSRHEFHVRSERARTKIIKLEDKAKRATEYYYHLKANLEHSVSIKEIEVKNAQMMKPLFTDEHRPPCRYKSDDWKGANPSTRGAGAGVDGAGGGGVVSQAKYVGCFKDCGGSRDLPVYKGRCSRKTCEERCKGYRYIGQTANNECRCGNTYGKQGFADGCHCNTEGMDKQTIGICKNCVYELQQNVPVAKIMNRTNITVEETMKNSTTPDFNGYVGCYKDFQFGKRDLPVFKGSGVSKTTCRSRCSKHAYFGRQANRECWCGDRFGTQGIEKSGCLCNAEYLGDERNCVYETSSAYEPSKPKLSWQMVFEQDNCVKNVDMGQNAVNHLFNQSFVFRYDIDGKPYAFYKRISPIKGRFSIYDLMLTHWKVDASHKLGRDFKLYSTEEDLANDTNEWSMCSDQFSGALNQGFPGSCGLSKQVKGFWAASNQNLQCGAANNVQFYVQTMGTEKPGWRSLKGGDGFVQFGDWRIGNVDGTHFAITHKSGVTATSFHKDTGMQGPRQVANDLWQRPSLEVTNVKIGDGLIEFADQWRLGHIKDLYLSLSHANGKTLFVWDHHGRKNNGPIEDYSTWDRSLKSTNVAFGERFVVLGKNWRLGQSTPFMVFGYAPTRTIAAAFSGENPAAAKPPDTDLTFQNFWSRPLLTTSQGSVLHLISNCNECNIPWCQKSALTVSINVEEDYTVGETLDVWGCNHVSTDSTHVKNSASGNVYVVEPLTDVAPSCSWGAKMAGFSPGSSLTHKTGVDSWEACQALCCHHPGCIAIAFDTNEKRITTCTLLDRSFEANRLDSTTSFVANMIGRASGMSDWSYFQGECLSLTGGKLTKVGVPSGNVALRNCQTLCASTSSCSGIEWKPRVLGQVDNCNFILGDEKAGTGSFDNLISRQVWQAGAQTVKESKQPKFETVCYVNPGYVKPVLFDESQFPLLQVGKKITLQSSATKDYCGTSGDSNLVTCDMTTKVIPGPPGLEQMTTSKTDERSVFVVIDVTAGRFSMMAHDGRFCTVDSNGMRCDRNELTSSDKFVPVPRGPQGPTENGKTVEGKPLYNLMFYHVKDLTMLCGDAGGETSPIVCDKTTPSLQTQFLVGQAPEEVFREETNVNKTISSMETSVASIAVELLDVSEGTSDEGDSDFMVQNKFGMCMYQPKPNEEKNPLQMRDCETKGKNADFVFVGNGFALKTKHFSNFCVTAEHVNKEGSRVILAKCKANDFGQKWEYLPETNVFRNYLTAHQQRSSSKGFCLDAPKRNEEGSSLVMKACEDNKMDQAWIVKSAPEAPDPPPPPPVFPPYKAYTYRGDPFFGEGYVYDKIGSNKKKNEKNNMLPTKTTQVTCRVSGVGYGNGQLLAVTYAGKQLQVSGNPRSSTSIQEFTFTPTNNNDDYLVVAAKDGGSPFEVDPRFFQKAPGPASQDHIEGPVTKGGAHKYRAPWYNMNHFDGATFIPTPAPPAALVPYNFTKNKKGPDVGEYKRSGRSLLTAGKKWVAPACGFGWLEGAGHVPNIPIGLNASNASTAVVADNQELGESSEIMEIEGNKKIWPQRLAAETLDACKEHCVGTEGCNSVEWKNTAQDASNEPDVGESTDPDQGCQLNNVILPPADAEEEDGFEGGYTYCYPNPCALGYRFMPGKANGNGIISKPAQPPVPTVNATNAGDASSATGADNEELGESSESVMSLFRKSLKNANEKYVYGNEAVESTQACEELCNTAKPPDFAQKCLSYEFSKTSKICSLFTVAEPEEAVSQGDIVFCAKQDDPCPEGYKIKYGEISGRGKVDGKGGGERIFPDCGKCGKMCNEANGCNSFECSPTKKSCELNTASMPEQDTQPFEDYMFCASKNAKPVTTGVPTAKPTPNPTSTPTAKPSPNPTAVPTKGSRYQGAGCRTGGVAIECRQDPAEGWDGINAFSNGWQAWSWNKGGAYRGNVGEDQGASYSFLDNLPYAEPMGMLGNQYTSKTTFTKEMVEEHLVGKGDGWHAPCVGHSAKTYLPGHTGTPTIFATNREFAVLRFKLSGNNPPNTIENKLSDITYELDLGWTHQLWRNTDNKLEQIDRLHSKLGAEAFSAVDWQFLRGNDTTTAADMSAVVQEPALPSGTTQQFLAKFMSNFRAELNSTYEFCIDTTESASLYLDGKLIIDSEQDKWTTSAALQCPNGFYENPYNTLLNNKYCARADEKGANPTTLTYWSTPSPPAPDYLRAAKLHRQAYILDWQEPQMDPEFPANLQCNKMDFPTPSPTPPPTTPPTGAPSKAPTAVDMMKMMAAAGAPVPPSVAPTAGPTAPPTEKVEKEFQFKLKGGWCMSFDETEDPPLGIAECKPEDDTQQFEMRKEDVNQYTLRTKADDEKCVSAKTKADRKMNEGNLVIEKCDWEDAGMLFNLIDGQLKNTGNIVGIKIDDKKPPTIEDDDGDGYCVTSGDGKHKAAEPVITGPVDPAAPPPEPLKRGKLIFKDCKSTKSYTTWVTTPDCGFCDSEKRKIKGMNPPLDKMITLGSSVRRILSLQDEPEMNLLETENAMQLDEDEDQSAASRHKPTKSDEGEDADKESMGMSYYTRRLLGIVDASSKVISSHSRKLLGGGKKATAPKPDGICDFETDCTRDCRIPGEGGGDGSRLNANGTQNSPTTPTEGEDEGNESTGLVSYYTRRLLGIVDVTSKVISSHSRKLLGSKKGGDAEIPEDPRDNEDDPPLEISWDEKEYEAKFKPYICNRKMAFIAGKWEGGCERPGPCVKCETGKFSDNKMQLCLDCKMGRFSENEASAECDKCPLGQFGNTTGATTCHKCPAGKSTLGSPGAPKCFNCLAGTYNDKPGTAMCKYCPVGKISTNAHVKKYSGAPNCTDCPANTFGSVVGQTKCTACPTGRRCDKGWKGCDSSIRTIKNDVMGGCLPNVCCCGRYGIGAILGACPSHGAAKCAACAKGYHLDPLDMKCKENICKCPNGIPKNEPWSAANRCTFNNEMLCKKCNPGFEFDSYNQRKCVPVANLVPDLPPATRSPQTKCVKVNFDDKLDNAMKPKIRELDLWVRPLASRAKLKAFGAASDTQWLGRNRKLKFTSNPDGPFEPIKFLSAQNVETSMAPQYVGCKTDCMGERDLPVSKGKGVTHAVCAMRCVGYKYYGMSGGSRCFCGMEGGRQGSAKGCECEAAVTNATKLKKCKNCVYSLPDPKTGFMETKKPPIPPGVFPWNSLQKPCVEPKLYDSTVNEKVSAPRMAIMANGLTSGEWHFAGDWGTSNRTGLNETDFAVCGSCITCVKMATIQNAEHFECDISNLKLREKMNKDGIWPITILYKGARDVYAYIASEMRAPFLDRIQTKTEKQCLIKRRLIRGVVSQDGHSVVWASKRSGIPGFTSFVNEPLSIKQPFKITGGDGAGEKCNGMYTYDGIKEGKISFTNQFSYSLVWNRGLKVAQEIVPAWTLQGGTNPDTPETVIRYYNIEKGANGDKKPPKLGWQTFDGNAGENTPYIEGGNPAANPVKYIKYPNDICQAKERPDILSQWGPDKGGVGTVMRDRCKEKCNELGDMCVGFLHVTSYVPPGEQSNPDKGKCFFRSGPMQVPTPAVSSNRLGADGRGAVFNQNRPNEVGDCYLKDPIPPGNFGRDGRKYSISFESDCAPGNGGEILKGKSSTGNGKECSKKCDEIPECIGFLHQLSAGDKCTFYTKNITHIANNFTDVRDCYKYDPEGTNQEDPYKNPYGVIPATSQFKRAVFNPTDNENMQSDNNNNVQGENQPDEEDENDPGHELGASLGLRTSLSDTEDHLLYPLSAWTKMCNVPKEDIAWNDFMTKENAALKRLKQTVETQLAEEKAKMRAVVTDYRAHLFGENATQHFIRTPLMNEAKVKIENERPEKAKTLKEIKEKEAAVHNETLLATRTSFTEKAHKKSSELLQKKFEKSIPQGADAALGNERSTKRTEIDEENKILETRNAVAARIDKRVTRLYNEAAAVREYNRKNHEVLNQIATKNGLSGVSSGYVWKGDIERQQHGHGGCKNVAVQNVAACLEGYPQIGCLRGKLVTINCDCPGPFIYKASVQQTVSPDFQSGKCPEKDSPTFRSHYEPKTDELLDWLEVCVYKTSKVEPPKPGTNCEAWADQNQMLLDAEAARDKAKADLIKLENEKSSYESRLNEAGEAAAVASTMIVDGKPTAGNVKAAEKASRIKMELSFVNTQIQSAKKIVRGAKLRLAAVRFVMPDVNSKELEFANKHLLQMQMQVKLRKAALNAAETAYAKFKSADIMKEIMRVQKLALAAEEHEMEAMQHVKWLSRKVSTKNNQEVRHKAIASQQPDPETIKAGKPVDSAEKNVKKLAGVYEKREKRNVLQEKITDAKLMKEKGTKSEIRIHGEVKSAQKELHSPESSKLILDKQLQLAKIQKEIFMSQQLVAHYHGKLSDIGPAPAHPAFEAAPTPGGPQRSVIEAAMFASAQELAQNNMNTIATPYKWVPQGAYCEQAFVIATGVCQKGPMIYTQCDLGPENSVVTVQAGCGCQGKFIQSVMVGNLKEVPNAAGLGAAQCAKEFHRYSEEARNKFFNWREQVNCAAAIEHQCKARQNTLQLDKMDRTGKPKEMREGMDKLEHDKNQLLSHTMDAYKMSVLQAQRTADKLRSQLADPSEWTKPISYKRIPGMKLDQGEEVTGEMGPQSCQMECSKDQSCKSVSFRPKDGLCLVSPSTLMYDDSWNAYLRTSDADSGGKSFNVIPGMKLQTPDDVVYAGNVKVTLDECKHDCLISDQCKSVSYSSVGVCIRGEAGIDYDDDWDYFEKQVATADWHNSYYDKVTKERREKKKLELSVIEQVIKTKRTHDAMSVQALAYQEIKPVAEAEAEANMVDDRLQRDVILPLP